MSKSSDIRDYGRDVIIQLIDLNTDKHDGARCNSISCRGARCHSCPMVGAYSDNGAIETLGDLRKVDPRLTPGEAPKADYQFTVGERVEYAYTGHLRTTIEKGWKGTIVKANETNPSGHVTVRIKWDNDPSRTCKHEVRYVKSLGCVNAPVEPNTKAAEYNGGSSDYYQVTITSTTTEGRPKYIAECNDIIEALGMNFAEGNAFKALWRRAAQRTLGKRKAGAKDDGLYDAQKVEFFGARLVAQSKGLADDSK